MLLLLLCMLAWPRLAWPSLTDSSTHRKHTQNPNPSIPQVPKCTNSVYVLCFCKRSAKNWCFRKFTYATIEFATAPHLTLSSATPTAHYFSALQLSVNNSGIFGFKMQMYRQQLSTRCKLGLLRGRWGQIHHIYIHICRYIYIYMCYIYSCACRHARDFILQMHIPLNCCKFVKVLMGQTFIALAIIMKRKKNKIN